MAFPVVASTGYSEQTTDTTTHTVVMPAGIAAGDLLLLLISLDGVPTLSGAGLTGSWTLLASGASGGTQTSLVYYKIATGSEANFTYTTSVAEKSSNVCMRITGADATTTPAISTAATGSDANPNAASLAAPWGTNDTLWIAVVTQARFISSYPANYTSNQATHATGTAATDTGLHHATRNLTTTPEDPGSFSMGGTNAWIAWTIAVPPVLSIALTLDLTDAVGLADAVEPAQGHDLPLADNATLSVDALLLDLVFTISDAVTLPDVFTADLGINLSFPDTMALAESLVTQLDQNLDLADPVALAESLTALLSQNLDFPETLLLVDLFDTVLTTSLDLADTVALIDAFSTSDANSIGNADAVGLVDDLTFAATSDVAFPDTVALADSFALSMEFGVVPTDTIALTDLIATESGSNIEPADSVGMDDEFIAAVGYQESFADTMPLSDSLNLGAGVPVPTGTITLSGMAPKAAKGVQAESGVIYLSGATLQTDGYWPPDSCSHITVSEDGRHAVTLPAEAPVTIEFVPKERVK